VSYPLRISISFLATAICLTFVLSCGKKGITPLKVTASSVLPQSPNYSYEAENASDGDVKTAWVEGVPGDGIGQSLFFRFQPETTLRELDIVNGFAHMHPTLGDLYSLNNRVARIRIHFDDGVEEFSLSDNIKDFQKLKFVNVHKSGTAKVVILQVYKGTKWQDTSISEIKFSGKNDRSNSHDTDSSDRIWVIRDSFHNAHPMEVNEAVIYTNRPQKYTKSECEQVLAKEASVSKRKQEANTKKENENRRLGKLEDENLPYPDEIPDLEGGRGESKCILQ